MLPTYTHDPDFGRGGAVRHVREMRRGDPVYTSEQMNAVPPYPSKGRGGPCASCGHSRVLHGMLAPAVCQASGCDCILFVPEE